MKKQKNKQGIKASKLAKAENLKKKANKFITVKNAEGDPDTTAEIVIQNKINYEPKVSVIIPVYNVEQYLRECLDSVVNQTLKEIEIICVDDGSTDSSLEILKEYAKKDNRITVMKQENRGSGPARNNAIKKSKGEFIAFMDSDDLYPSEKTLKTMYEKAIKNNVLICGGSLNQLNEGKLITDPSKFEDGYSFKKEGIVEYKDYQFDYGYWRFIYKREFLVENILYFPDYLRGQDPPFFIKAMSLAEKFYAVIEPTYVYRVSHKEINWTERKVLDTIKSLTDCLQQTKDNNLDELHYSIAKRLCNSWFINAFRNITKDNITCFTHMLNALNFSSIFKYDKNFKLPYFYQLLPNISRVCIVIPIYNVEQYLRECLDSVINQTYKNLEIICINDGSTDNSLEILNEYARKDDRIKVISQKNGGLSVARNTGLDNCNSEFVYFIDSDDYIAQNTIEILYNKIIDDYSDVAIGGVQCFGDEGIVVSKQHWFDSYNKSGRFNVVADVRNDVISISCNKLYKMSIIKEYGIRFPEGLINEDEYWLWAYMIHCKTYSSVRDKLYFYRQHKNSIMGKKDNSAKILDIIDIHCKIYEEIAKYKNKEDFENVLTAVFIAQVGRLHNIIPKEYIELYKEKIVHYYNSYNNSEKIKQFLNSFSPKVSVIIPVYNVEKYLSECLDSILNQTLKDIEIICVDDGSTDSSLKILKDYAKKDNRIKLLTQKHKKQGAARNLGLKKATGKYIFFCDSDDFINKETLKNLYYKIEKEQAEICQYRLCVFDNKYKKIINIREDFYNKITKIGKTYDYKILPNLIFERVEPVLKLYKRDFLIDNNIRFFENCYFEDTIVHIKCMSLAKRICFDDNVYYYYRKNRDGQTTGQSGNSKKFLDIFNYINEAESFFKHHNMWEDVKNIYYSFAVGRICNYYNQCNDKTKVLFSKKTKDWLRNKNINEIKENARNLFPSFCEITNLTKSPSLIKSYLLLPYYLLKIKYMKRILGRKPSRLFSVTKYGNKKVYRILGFKFAFNNFKKDMLDNQEKITSLVYDMTAQIKNEINKQNQSVDKAIKSIDKKQTEISNNIKQELDKLALVQNSLEAKIKADVRSLTEANMFELNKINEEISANKQRLVALEDLITEASQQINDVVISGINNNLDNISQLNNVVKANGSDICSEISSLYKEHSAQLQSLKEQVVINRNNIVAKLDDNAASIQTLTEQAQSNRENIVAKLEDNNTNIREFKEDILNKYQEQDYSALLQNSIDQLQTLTEQAQSNRDNIVAKLEDNNATICELKEDILNKYQEQDCSELLQSSINQLQSLKEQAQSNRENIVAKLDSNNTNVLEFKKDILNKYQELNYADLLHDSIINSDWLKNKSFSLYGWAANYSFIYTLFRILDKAMPKNILEMGLGQTTRLTTQYVANKNNGANLMVCEHDKNWINIYSQELAKSDNIKIQHFELEYFDFDGKPNDKYKDMPQIVGDKKFDLIIVDGPVGGGKNLPRSNIIDLIPNNLAEDFVIIIDDTERAGEQATIRKIKEKLNENGIKYSVSERNSIKRQTLILSPNREFIKFL